jgi:hypothetical protein
MKKSILFLLSLCIIVSCYAQKQAFFDSDSVKSTALIKTKGGISFKKAPVLVKVNGQYNHYYGKQGSYNLSPNLNIHLLVPAGNTSLEIIFKGAPPVELTFLAEKDCEYNILADEQDEKCVKVCKKVGEAYQPVSPCGREILYKETACSNCALVTSKLTVFKLDGLYGNEYGLFPVYIFPRKYEFKLEAGKHIFEVMSTYSAKPVAFEVLLEAGKTYTIDAESKKGLWNPIIKEKTK